MCPWPVLLDFSIVLSSLALHPRYSVKKKIPGGVSECWNVKPANPPGSASGCAILSADLP